MRTPVLSNSYLNDWVAGQVDEVMSQLHDEWNKYWDDLIFEYVDSAWTNLGFEGGLISEWDVIPAVDDMERIAVILQWGISEGYEETDTGLWEGLHAVAQLASQAFFTLLNGVNQGVWSALEEYEKGHDCDECKGGKCGECESNMLWEYGEPCEDEDDE